MRDPLHHPQSAGGHDRPLIGGVEALDSGRPAPGGEDRDEAIIRLLREKLRARNPGNLPATQAGRKGEGSGAEDRYEPQRLGRKICWQYDASARRVPLLRRPYI